MTGLTPTTQPDSAPRELSGDFAYLTGIIRRGWRLIAFAVLICLTIAVIYLAQAKRIYQATTRILVIHQGGKPLSIGRGDSAPAQEGSNDLISTHAVVIASPLIVDRAIASVGLKSLPSLADAKSPINEAIRQLTVSRPDKKAQILQIDYRAGSRDEAIRMVVAIKESYEKFLEDSYQRNNGEVVSLITRARDELNAELDELERKYQEFHRRSSTLMVDESGRSFNVRRLDRWDRAINEAMVKAVQLRAQLELGRTLAREGTELWAVAHAMGQLGGDTSTVASFATVGTQPMTAEYVRQLVQEQQQLAERYGPQNSKVRELHEQIARIQEHARSVRSDLDQPEIRDLLGAIGHSLESIETMRVELGKRFEHDLEQAKKDEMDRLTEANLRSSLDRHRSLFNTVVEQLKQAQFVSDFSNINSQTIERPNAHPSPVAPRVPLILAVALMAGCLIGTGAAVVVDRLDERIHTLEDLRRVLGLFVLGQIPQVRKEQAAGAGHIGLISHAMPRSSCAEAYRAARTNIEFLRRNQSVKVILVVSPQSGDGKSTSASNLGISLAQAGRKVLLVDADLRKPSQHLIHGLPNDRGLTHVLQNLMPARSVVQQPPIENLDVIASGPFVPNPAELLASARFIEFLDEVRQSYDAVIIDSSPLLAVADPAIIGATVDGLVLVVQASSIKISEAENTLELLRTLEAPVLGMLINRISRERFGYGYGRGIYGYGKQSTEDADIPEVEVGSGLSVGPMEGHMATIPPETNHRHTNP